jgi:aspartate/methionine/tyrosine aminotransferase
MQMQARYINQVTFRADIQSPYMQFAKLRSHAKYNLATSGMQNFPFAELDLEAGDEKLDLHGPNSYGYAKLRERIADYCGVAPDMVVHLAGTSQANHIAMAAAFDPGEEVLVEEPAYELLLTTAEFLGARIRRFPRMRENDFKIDPYDVERAMTPSTRLIVLCNLHNPTSVGVDETTMLALGEIAAKNGARVLVDEVYLELLHPRPRTAAMLGKQFIVTSSLTKAYGLSGLRCGWVICEPELARRMYLLRDMFEGVGPFLMDQYSVIAFAQLHRIRERAQGILAANRPLVLDMLKRHSDLLECVVPESGTTVAPRLKYGSAEEFCRFLRERYETAVVPGRFFEMPEHFRLGFAGDPEVTRAGLRLLSAALGDWSRR